MTIIWVPSSELILVDINNIPDEDYRNLLNSQLRFLNSIQDSLKKKAKDLYQLVGSNDEILSDIQIKIKQRCIDFPLLQNKSRLSVSYTHLDVYKRQVVYIKNNRFGKIF